MDEGISFRTVLVVGGSGFLGHHLVRDILRKGNGRIQISVMDLEVDRNRIESVDYHQCDITARDHVERVLKQVMPEVIFHTATPNPFEPNHALLEKVNVLGTRNLIECAQQVQVVRAFIYTSSSSVVHDHVHPIVNATEDLPVLHFPQQPEIYSHTKALAEELVLAANRSGSNMLTVSIRPASLYGEGDEMMTRNIVRNAQAGRANIQIGPGGNLFDNTYVQNCTYAHILAAEALLKAGESPPCPEDERVEGEAFFVTNDDPYVFWATNRLVAEFVGRPVQEQDIRVIPIWLMLLIASISEWLYWIFTLGRKEPKLTRRVVRLLTMERTFCIEKIKKRLKYRPLFTTAQGMQRAVDWFLDQNTSNGPDKKGQ